MIPLGTNQDKPTQFMTIGRFKEFGEYCHRILDGPRKRNIVYYPTLKQDNDTGTLTSATHSISLPISDIGTRTIVDKLSALDKKVQELHGEKEPKSVLKRVSRDIFIVISRDLYEENQVWLNAWEYPYSLSTKVMELHKQESKKDKTKLMYGTYWMWDAVIKKQRTDEKRNIQYSTEYTCTVDPESAKMMGTIPVEFANPEYLRTHAEEIEEYLLDIYPKVFLPEELEAMEKFFAEHTINDFLKPVATDAEIIEMFKTFPINFNAEDDKGNPIFRYKDDLFQEIYNFKDKLLSAATEPSLSLPEHEETEVNIDTQPDPAPEVKSEVTAPSKTTTKRGKPQRISYASEAPAQNTPEVAVQDTIQYDPQVTPSEDDWDSFK